MSPGVKTYQICFSKKYKKLDPLALTFTTVRWLDSFYKLGKVYEIFYVVPNLYHQKIHLGSARLIKLEIKTIDDLDASFCQRDADCGTAEFYDLMRSWYEQKKDWKGANSEIQVLTLMRVFYVSASEIHSQERKAMLKQEPLEVFAT